MVLHSGGLGKQLEATAAARCSWIPCCSIVWTACTKGFNGIAGGSGSFAVQGQAVELKT